MVSLVPKLYVNRPQTSKIVLEAIWRKKLRAQYGIARTLVDLLEIDESPALEEARQTRDELAAVLKVHDPEFEEVNYD